MGHHSSTSTVFTEKDPGELIKVKRSIPSSQFALPID